MKRFVLLILGMSVVFWNVENFFESRPGFSSKARAIAKTIMLASDYLGSPPDIVALAEVENAACLKKLVYGTPLYKLNYGYVHFDSPDRRGIDCALIYRKDMLAPKKAEPKHLYDSAGKVLPTRDILLVEFDTLAVLVNHHPSKIGRNGTANRKIAMERMEAVCDSLSREGVRKILCVGDFNDNLWGDFKQGTIKYNGVWDKIDGYFSRGLSVREEVFSPPVLMVEDRSFGGMKPYRAYSGPRYIGGVSDHFPIILTIFASDL